jgi:hypothetical protein
MTRALAALALLLAALSASAHGPQPCPGETPSHGCPEERRQ